MAQQDNSQRRAKAAVTTCGKPKKGDVKMSIVKMCGPSSVDILGQLYQRTALPVNRHYPVQRRKPWPYVPCMMGFAPVQAVDKNLVSKDKGRFVSMPPFSPTTVQFGSAKNVIYSKSGKCGQRVKARLYSVRLVDKLAGPTIKNCRGIQPLRQFILCPENQPAVIP